MKKIMALLIGALAAFAVWAQDINVGPLLTTKWDQISPYINFGPIKPDQEDGYSYENHMVNGCVAVAYSQVLKYWNWPEKLDEDITYSHMANSTPGYVQTLPAGTEFNWDKQLDDYVTAKSTEAQQLYLGLGQIYTAMLTEMKFNLTMSGVNLERAIDNSYYMPGDLLNTVGQTTLAMCKDQARDSIVGGMPLIMGVTVNRSGSSISHAIVGDGWKESEGSDPQISCNYGWGGASDGFTAFNLETSRFIANLKPRPMVIIDAVPYHAALPVKVTWHFPKKGYENALSGFDVMAYKVTDETYTWEEDFDSPQGSGWGEGVSTGTLAGSGNDGNMLKFSTESGRDYYAWPTMFLGEGSVLSFRVRSDHIRSHQTAWVEAYEANRGWKKIRDLTLYEFPPEVDNGWENVTIELDNAYDNKAVGFRIRTARAAAGDNWGQALAYGIQIDDVKVTNVRKVEATPTATQTVGSALRSASFDNGLDVGTKYMFIVEPLVADGVKSNGTGAEIVASEPEKVRFYGVQSIRSNDPQFDSENIFREAYLGTNQFAVFGSPTMTKLRAKLSQTQLIDFCWAPDAAGAPGAVIASCGPVSVADAVKVERAEPGKFLVTVDFSCCTKALRYTREIITLEGEDNLGNIVRKNIVLRFSKIGNETAITQEQLPEYGGTIPGEEEEEEDLVTTSYQVSFATMGGTTVSQKTVESGKAIGSLPSTMRDGYDFLGWFTEISGGTKVTKDTVITGNVIFFAQWKESAPAVTTYTVTFDPNGGSPEMSRFVNENAVVGTLPTTVTKSGYKLTGWYTAKDGGENISASQVITGNVTYYAHWEISSGGGTGGGSSDDGATRFCHGVSKTTGAYDVTRTTGYTNRLIPTGCNLIFWWVDRYEEVHGSLPSGYDATKVVANQNDGTHTIQSYVDKLITDCGLSQTLPEGSEREQYFPSLQYSAQEWYGTGAQDMWARQAGKQIYAALANGPIAVKVPTSSSYYFGAVIWGCDYAVDGNDKYATALYITDTTTNKRSDQVVRFEFGLYTNGYGTYPGIKNFNGTGNHGVIEYYYPIVGPAGTSQPDDPVVTTHKVTFDADGGTAVDTISVEDGGTISTLPVTVKSGYDFLGWFNGSDELTTSTKISADITYTAHWQEKVVTPTTYTVVFNANGGTVSEVSREVACNTAVGELPVPTYAGHLFGGWYLDGTAVDKATVVDADVVYVAQWTVIDPTEDEPIGYASNDKNPGNNYTASYQYEMYDNYYTARKRAIQQGKQLFVLSGASWCSNCAFVKSYLTTLGAEFTDKFIVYYSNHDDDVSSPYFHGGLPQYGAADPRVIDAFTGTLDGTTRTWSSAWTTAGCGIYKQDRGGYASDRVDTVVAAGQAKAAYSYPTALVIRGLSTLAAGYAGQYELYAQFADGVEMPVDYGVTWSVVSGNGKLANANVDGREVTALTITSGDVILKATSSFYFTGTKTITVKSTDLSNVESVAINTTSVNLEDDATPLIDAVATMKDGSQIAVVGFGEWSAAFKSRIDRKDADLEEDNVTPTITFDNNSRLTYAKANGKLAVCDQKIDVTLTVNGKSATKEITVWGPTKVAPSKWTMISGPKQTALGVVRLQCTELKYNYGGQIYTTKDTYFASYKTVLKYDSGKTDESFLRGLTIMSSSEKGENVKVGLAATKMNGKYTGYTPADPTASKLATNFTNVAKGTTVTDLDHGSVPTGFFQAFFPFRTDYATLAEEDSDGDGFKNWEEYVLGTDPTNKNDAFTLMQGYQHLAAPAASGDTMQYKVMYQQRARRIYYIEAKKTWSEGWTPVATVSLANAAESDVTSFTELNASYADAAKFFRVRASLYEHVFNDPTTAPKITPNMLVAAPDAVIDLTNEPLPLNLSSFDTDATDPGTVYVKVPAGTKAGDVLITAPAVAAKSMAALAPQDLADGLKFIVEETTAGKLALKVAASVTPSIEGGDEKGTVVVDDEKVVITPAENVTEITLDHPGERKVEIPPSIEKIGGVTDSGKIVIKSGSHDITKAMKFTAEGGSFRIELNEAAVVKVGSEDISVTPELASGNNEVPFEVKDGQLVFNVKSIPGLKYKVLVSDTLDPSGFSSTAQGTGAELSRCELKVSQPSGKTRSFYKIQVSR